MPRDRTRDLLNKLKDEERKAKKDYDKRIRSIRKTMEEIDDISPDFMLRLNEYNQTAQIIFNKIEEIKSAYG